MDDFKVDLQVMIDNSSLTNVQKQLAKERLKVNADISIEDFAKSKQEAKKQIADFATSIKNILGNTVSDKQANQWAKQYYNQMITNAKQATKEQMSFINAMSKGREQAELARQAEEKRQQSAQANAVNKALENEYKERQRNIQATEKQMELDRKNALVFTESASKKLSSAISKYSYGDTSDATAMLKQMNLGLSNFGDLSNVQGNISKLSSIIGKIISDLKVSHEQSLNDLNNEIKAEQNLQSQKDAFNKKNLNAIDYEIQKREQEAKTFSSMLQTQMQEQQNLTGIKNSISDKGDITAQIKTLSNSFTRLGLSADEVKTKMNGVDTELIELRTLLNSGASNSEIASQFNKLQLVLNETQNDLKITRSEYSLLVTDQQRLSKANTIEAWNLKNKNATHEVLSANEAYINSLRDLNTEMSQVKFNEISDGFSRMKNSMTALGKISTAVKGQIAQVATSLVSFMSLSRVVMQAVNWFTRMPSTVTTLDTALVDLKKTANMSTQELEDFYYASNDVAKQMGVTTVEILNQASAWSRLGFSTAEQATQMAKLSSQFALISPGMDVDQATSGLVSIMKAYDIDVNDVLDGIESKINIIGNNLALSNANIVAMLQDSVSAMAEGRNSLEETIALEAAAYEITQNESVGNGFKTVALRLRGMNEETEELDDSLNNIKGDLYELTGISIMENENTYKSTFQILEEISKVWDSLTDKTKADALELMFGKQRSNIGAAVLKNFSAAEKAMKLMANSAGNADAELSVAMDSIEYKMNRLSESGTSIAQNLFQRDDIKTVVDGLTSILNIVDKLTEKLGLFGTISAIGGGIAGAKGLG